MSYRPPTLGRKEVDLYRLFREVTAYGGCDSVVSKEGTWAKIYRGLDNFSPTETSASFRLKKMYTKYLLAYEKHIFNFLPIPQKKHRYSHPGSTPPPQPSAITATQPSQPTLTGGIQNSAIFPPSYSYPSAEDPSSTSSVGMHPSKRAKTVANTTTAGNPPATAPPANSAQGVNPAGVMQSMVVGTGATSIPLPTSTANPSVNANTSPAYSSSESFSMYSSHPLHQTNLLASSTKYKPGAGIGLAGGAVSPPPPMHLAGRAPMTRASKRNSMETVQAGSLSPRVGMGGAGGAGGAGEGMRDHEVGGHRLRGSISPTLGAHVRKG